MNLKCRNIVSRIPRLSRSVRLICLSGERTKSREGDKKEPAASWASKKVGIGSYATQMTTLICTSCKTRQNMVSANLSAPASAPEWLKAEANLIAMAIRLSPASAAFLTSNLARPPHTTLKLEMTNNLISSEKSIVHHKTWFCHQQKSLSWHKLNYFMFASPAPSPPRLASSSASFAYLTRLHCHIRFLIRLGGERGRCQGAKTFSRAQRR